MKFFYKNVEFVYLLRRKTIRAMKLIAIFTLAAIFQLRAEVHSQSFNFNETNTTVKQMFKQIEKNSKYSIFYRLDQIDLNRKVNVVSIDGSIQNVIGQILKNQPLTFEIVEQVIVIKLIEYQESELRNIVKGQVKDSRGETLPGVSVRVKGTNIGATTDAQGNFNVNSPENGVLVLSYVGYISQEVSLNGRSEINIVLLEDQQVLGEVVVTALGIERESKTLTYSAQTIKSDKLNEAKETNLINSLQGKIAGVTITRNATGPGSSSKVLLRGSRSIGGNNQPLYVIDGVPMDNSTRSQGGGTAGGRDGGDGI